jgi:L-ascorbate metabolism protein UlaG (beta-lactamase superfamily)
MELRLIRNATLRLRYGGVDFLIDPMLGVRHSIRPMGDSPGRNPTVEMPCSVDEVIGGADVVIVSHLHPDHFDEAAFGLVPRRLPIICQVADGDKLTAVGFEVTELTTTIHYRGVETKPVSATHGSGPILDRMGSVTGLVFRADTEPTLYWSGDTIMTDAVRDTIVDTRPDVVVTHSGGATAGGTTIIMDIGDTLEVASLAASAIIIAVHLEAVAHAPITRAALRMAADQAGIGPDRLRIPADGDTLKISPRSSATAPTIG